MTTTNAAFDSWERRWAYYYVYGGSQAAYAALSSANKLPQRVVNPSSAFAWMTLVRSDPRGNVVWPNHFRLDTTRNALEPTTAEWENYAIQQVFRDNNGVNDLVVVESPSGSWRVRNRDDIVFPASGAASTGGTYLYAVLLIGNYDTAPVPMYATHVAELDSPVIIPAGGTGAVTLTAGGLDFEKL